MKIYAIQIIVRSPINQNKTLDINVIEDDDLISLLARFPFMVIRAKEKHDEEIERHTIKQQVGQDDDIPF